LLKGLGRFSDKLLVLDAYARGDSLPIGTLAVGPVSIVDRLWRECGIADVLTELLAGRRLDFADEGAIFLTVVHRLLAPGSNGAASGGVTITRGRGPMPSSCIISIARWRSWGRAIRSARSCGPAIQPMSRRFCRSWIG